MGTSPVNSHKLTSRNRTVRCFDFVQYRAETYQGQEWGVMKTPLRSDAEVPVGAVVEAGTGGRLEFDQ